MKGTRIKAGATAALLALAALAAPAAAQEAARNTEPAVLVGGTSDMIIWVSMASYRKGDQLSFWLLTMPKADTAFRYHDEAAGTIRNAAYDVGAQLFEANCSARQTIRRVRHEFYLDGQLIRQATGTAQHAETVNLLPTSNAGHGLEAVCAGLGTGTRAPNLAEARRMTDAHFAKAGTAKPAPAGGQ